MILVTGAAGFIGSHFVELLLARGHRVRCFLRPASSTAWIDASHTEIAFGELETGEGIKEAVAGVDTVVHVAGIIKALSREAFLKGNASATANLVRAAADAGVQRFVHISSTAAGGPSPKGILLDEFAPASPIGPYGHSKLRAEEAVRSSALAGISVIVRPCGVYGPRDKDLFRFFLAVSRGRILRIGAEDCRFNLIYVKDLVKGIYAAVTRAGVGGGTYTLAHPVPLSWSELGSEAAAILERPARPVILPATAALGIGLVAEGWARLTGKPGILSREQVRAALANWTFDTRLGSENLGFTASTSLPEGLRETLAWYRSEGWLP